ncbi:MAG: F0F1 ATP synthase subunit A [Firmicutes bacterium]|nr:F0F1 ATP synthase subunit A [Bacillota bacterium]
MNNENKNLEHAEEGNVFTEVFTSMLGDHSGFYVGPYRVFDLPQIIFDGNSLRFYKNQNEMKKDGVYTEIHHQIVRTSDHEPVQLDLSITNLVVFQWIAMIFLLSIFKFITRKKVLKPTIAPRGFFANAVEKIILYIRDEVVIPNFESRKIADKLTYYFFATFIFILTVNLLGLIPGGHTATASIPMSAALAIVAFFVINGSAIKFSGIKSWFKHLLGGAPPFLAPIMIPIEVLGLVIKPFSLTIRLFANMTAGHIILFALLGLLFYFNTYILAAAIVPFSVFIYLLELLVAFIQAFVFTMLVSIYTSQSIGSHSDEH